MLLADMFIKMLQREIGVDVALEPAQQLDGAGLKPSHDSKQQIFAARQKSWMYF